MSVPHQSDSPLAIEPLFMLINHHYRMRQQPGIAQLLDRDQHDPHDPLLRRFIAAESSLGLLLPMLSEILYVPTPDNLISLGERLALDLGTLEGFLANATPIDAVAPRISNLIQRQYLMPARLASLLVHTTLVVVLSALADEAKWIIVKTPRTGQGGVQITVEADAAGLSDGINARLKERITQKLRQHAGTLTITTTDNKTWSDTIWLPETWNAHTEVSAHVVA
jgi:hypothetical protein